MVSKEIVVHIHYHVKTEQSPPVLGNNHPTQLSASSLQLVLFLCYPLAYRFATQQFRTHHGPAISLSSIFLPFEPFFALELFQKRIERVGHVPGRNEIEFQA
jgi:hypothetical protein